MNEIEIHIPDKYKFENIVKNVDMSLNDIFSNIIYLNIAIEYFFIEIFTSFDINIEESNVEHNITDEIRLNIFNTFTNGYTLFKHILINIFLYSNNCRASIFYAKICTLYYIELIKQGASFMDAYVFVFKKILFNIPSYDIKPTVEYSADFLKSYLDMYDYVLITTLKHILNEKIFTTQKISELVRYKLKVIIDEWNNIQKYREKGIVIYDNIQSKDNLNYLLHIKKNGNLYPLLFPYFIDFNGDVIDLLKFKIFINSI